MRSSRLNLLRSIPLSFHYSRHYSLSSSNRASLSAHLPDRHASSLSQYDSANDAPTHRNGPRTEDQPLGYLAIDAITIQDSPAGRQPHASSASLTAQV